MRVVDVAVRQCYRFNCPNCGSKLEADCDELVDIGGKMNDESVLVPCLPKGSVCPLECSEETDGL